VLFHLKKRDYRIEHFVPLKEDMSVFLPGTCTANEFRVEELAVPANHEVYLDHLHSLNLLQFVEKEPQKPTFDQESRKQTGVIHRRIVRVMKFGRLFVQAWVPDEFLPDWRPIQIAQQAFGRLSGAGSRRLSSGLPTED
jgi:hypothetical protein